jgi:hypothetical protein
VSVLGTLLCAATCACSWLWWQQLSECQHRLLCCIHRSAAAEAKENALLVYIQQQLEYAKMWKLLEFSQVRLVFHYRC